MISVSEALLIIGFHVPDLGTEKIGLRTALGRTLEEEWYADRDLPPYDRVTMDGIGINYGSWEKGQRTYKIEGIAAAGMPQQALSDSNCCTEVMTGGVTPSGVDVVVRYEDLIIADGAASITADSIKQGQNIHIQGQDRKAGELIVAKGTVLSSAEIGIGAGLGKVEVEVRKLPRAMVVSTGDELVEIDQDPLPHQIRKSNVYRIEATLSSWGLQVDTSHLADDKEEIEERLAEYLEEYDVLILSGGVSKGKFDFLPEVLASLDVEKHFHGVRQRPGKPFWFGTKDNCTVFALPGNPISSFLCTHKYFQHWLSLQQKKPHFREVAILKDDVSFKPKLTYFLEVSLERDDKGVLYAIPQKGNGSGDMANLVEADAFIELPNGQDEYLKGEAFQIHRYR